jgi:serine/threonine protein kinase/tetratricopeptide (TPR) repeat protein
LSYVGSSIGSIRIESRLAKGGMGEVYLGYDPRLDRRVAVKTIRAERRLSPQLKARFLREARLLSKLGHPSICQVYDLVETPEADFLILEYVPGATLRRFAERAALSVEQALGIAEKIAVALAVAHREKIVHRDLKADNIMVTPDGEVKVLDFGIARSLAEPDVVLALAPALPDPFATAGFEADPEETDADSTHALGPGRFQPAASTSGSDEERLTRLGMVVGTLSVMSPEQATGGEVTEASDLYSLGILLQELLTRRPAYADLRGEDLRELVAQARTLPLIVPQAGPEGGADFDPDLVRLVLDLQNLDPRRRPTAEETAGRLRGVLEKPQRLRRQRLRLAAVAAAFVVLLAVLAVVSWLAVRAEGARREADHRRRQAESLIGFMLGDLRHKLEEVNRLDVLDAVGDHALAYFDAVPESQLTAGELADRASAITQIGEVRYTQGNLPAARAAFTRSRALSRDLRARYPGDPAGWSSLLLATYWIGQVDFDQRRLDDAMAAWTEHLRLAREHLRLHPRDAEAPGFLATSLHNLGSLLDLRGDLAGALGFYRESLELQRRLAAAQPGNDERQSEIAATLAFVSNDLERQGDLAAALAERRNHLAINERLVARQPGNPLLRQDLATARGFVATLLVPLGELAEARKLDEQGLAELARLAEQDPENTLLQRWLGAFHSALGALATAEGHPAAALAPLGEARAIFTRLVAKDPTSSDWRLQLGISRSRTAAALAALGDPDLARARAEVREALAVLAPLLKGEPEEAARGLIAEAEVLRGRIATALGDSDEARQAWERALAVLAPCRRPLTYWKVLAPWTGALAGLGRAAEAKPGLDRLAAMGFR